MKRLAKIKKFTYSSTNWCRNIVYYTDGNNSTPVGFNYSETILVDKLNEIIEAINLIRDERQNKKSCIKNLKKEII